MAEGNVLEGLRIYPVTPDRWEDLVELFGSRGACSGCWCMYWRLSRKDFQAGQGDGNRGLLKSLVDAIQMPGLLAYLDGKAVGWCSIGPRRVFPTLNRSYLLKPVDDQPVWSVVCFFVDRRYRRRGLTIELLKGAVRYATGQGAKIVEGYPVIPRKEKADPPSIFTGAYAAFQEAGFVEVAHRTETRAVMRFYINDKND